MSDERPWEDYADPVSRTATAPVVTGNSRIDEEFSALNDPNVGYGEDIAKGAVGGLGRGLTGLAGTGGNVGNLSGRTKAGVPESVLNTGAKAARVLGSAIPVFGALTGPDSAGIQKEVEGVTGNFYQPGSDHPRTICFHHCRICAIGVNPRRRRHRRPCPQHRRAGAGVRDGWAVHQGHSGGAVGARRRGSRRRPRRSQGHHADSAGNSRATGHDRRARAEGQFCLTAGPAHRIEDAAMAGVQCGGYARISGSRGRDELGAGECRRPRHYREDIRSRRTQVAWCPRRRQPS